MKYRSGVYVFEIALSGRVSPALRTALYKAAKAALAGLPARVLRESLRPGAEYALSLAVVTKEKIRKLNADYRGKDKPTDVLSFPRLDSPAPDIGDVVLCGAVAREQAKAYGATLAEEYQRLAVHGILHLFGYDHERGPKEARRQFGLQNRILKKL